MKHTLLALALAAAPLAAHAIDTDSGLSYSYVEGGYVQTRGEIEDGLGIKHTMKADGYGVGGSVAVAPNFHLFGSYATQKPDGMDIDFDQWHLGAGYNHTIAPTADLVARVAYDRYDAGLDDSFDGISVEAGVRAAFTPNFEAYAFAGYERFGNNGEYYRGDNDDFYGHVGALVKFNPTWGITGDVKLFDNGDTQWFVGPRASF